MIIADIVGGLGNQMFQYAAAVSVAKMYEHELVLDISTFSHPKYENPEGFLLSTVFDINARIAAFRDYYRVLGVASCLKKYKHRLKFSKFVKNFVLENELFSLNPSLLQSAQSTDVYMCGWWQTYRYLEVANMCPHEVFEFKPLSLPPLYSRTLDMIKNNSESTVCVHIRRGDYVTNPVFNKMYGVCDIGYVQRGLAKIREAGHVGDSNVFVFSNDPVWCSQDQVLRQYTIVSTEKASSWFDLYLMSQCSHNIVANSSFSWWGAMLNRNPNKIVIAPQKWFLDGTSTPELIPPSWIVL